MGSGDNGRPQGSRLPEKLVWRTTEGFNVRPYYRAEDLEGIKYLGKKSGEFPYVRGNRCNNRWRIHETIAVKDVAEANRLALHAVEAGADSIGFDLSEKLSAQQVADLMAGIDLNATELAFSGKPDAELPDKVLSVAEAKRRTRRNSVYFSASTRSSGSFRSRAPSATATTDSSVTRPSPGSSGGPRRGPRRNS